MLLHFLKECSDIASGNFFEVADPYLQVVMPVLSELCQKVSTEYFWKITMLYIPSESGP